MIKTPPRSVKATAQILAKSRWARLKTKAPTMNASPLFSKRGASYSSGLAPPKQYVTWVGRIGFVRSVTKIAVSAAMGAATRIGSTTAQVALKDGGRSVGLPKSA